MSTATPDRRATGLLRRVVPAVLAVLALSLSACATAAGPTTAPVGAAGATAPATALGFSGTTLDGAPLDAATLAGKPVVLWFWAPWCTICRSEAPDVAKIAAEYAGRVSFVGVAGRDEVEAMRTFVSDTATGGFTHLADVGGELWTRFGVLAQPAFVFVDRSGSAGPLVGHLDGQRLRTMVDQLAAS